MTPRVGHKLLYLPTNTYATVREITEHCVILKVQDARDPKKITTHVVTKEGFKSVADIPRVATRKK